jgi:hypothetical protein
MEEIANLKDATEKKETIDPPEEEDRKGLETVTAEREESEFHFLPKRSYNILSTIRSRQCQ